MLLLHIWSRMSFIQWIENSSKHRASFPFAFFRRDGTFKAILPTRNINGKFRSKSNKKTSFVSVALESTLLNICICPGMQALFKGWISQGKSKQLGIVTTITWVLLNLFVSSWWPGGRRQNAPRSYSEVSNNSTAWNKRTGWPIIKKV